MSQEKLNKVSETYTLSNGLNARVQVLTDTLIRISCSPKLTFPEPLLNRYGFIKDDWPVANVEKSADEMGWDIRTDNMHLRIDKRTGSITISSILTKEFYVHVNDNGFRLLTSLDENDRLFGLGDENRESIMKRGRQATLWVRNVKCYIPIPFLASSNGWGIMMNTTFKHHYDLGASQTDQLKVWANEGPCDFYVMFAENLPGLLDAYTQLTGRPAMLPKYAFGYMFICNEENNARAMIDDAYRFRQSEIPCDCIGLEPDWMEKHYDFSVNKKWHPQKFYIPYWIRDMHRHHPITFFGALHRLGFRLSLWLCCDYDLLWEEEKRSAEQDKGSWDQDSQIADEHFAEDVRLDKTTVQGQPWFEHLKQFVNQGVSAFKLDGANYVLEHPDRVWADRYRDSEVHNLLPLVYGRQMSQGYTAQTQERAMINIPMGYAGIQKYCATWAGDTGGGAKPLVSMLNLGHSGVSSTSCDIDVNDIQGIHFGFLQAWTQQNNWNYWLQPWLLGSDLEEAVRDYARLRSSLFPYLYSYAHVAHETGMPLMRSLPLTYPNTTRYDQVLTQFMLGDALLVGAFTETIILPPGAWFDYWTGERLEGDRTISYSPPANRGGGLFVKAGSIIPLQPWSPCLERYTPDCLDLHIYCGGNSVMHLYEDDGITEQYLEGAFAKTRIELIQNGASHTLRIDQRCGSYQGMAPVTAFNVYLHGIGPEINVVSANGTAIDTKYEDGILCFSVTADQHMANDLTYTWQ